MVVIKCRFVFRYVGFNQYILGLGAGFGGWVFKGNSHVAKSWPHLASRAARRAKAH